jgi:hypothetical protein
MKTSLLVEVIGWALIGLMGVNSLALLLLATK